MDKASKVEATFYGLLKRVFQEEKKQIDLSNASNIRALLLILCNSRERRDRIFDEYGNVRQNISIFINGRNILFLKGLETELNAGDSVAIFPPMAGG
ncbi:MAG: MoaD family protein [Desulfobacterales bacterium]|jgi:molybdopterin synthase sulfur carrier subunit|nr:MoaD family protein [Desulfobacterales bacterium]